MNLKESYLKKASSLVSRLLDEEEDIENVSTDDVTDETAYEQETDVAEEAEEAEEVTTDEPIEIFFDNLDEETQKKLLETLKVELNATEDDDYAQEKIINALSQKPLVSLRAEEVVRKLNIDI